MGPPPGSQQPPAQPGQSKRLQQTQAQVDEVVGIMRSNVNKVLERDQKLGELDSRAGRDACSKRARTRMFIADALQEGASQFEKSAAHLKRKYWWKNIKMIIIMVIIVLIILIIIISKSSLVALGDHFGSSLQTRNNFNLNHSLHKFHRHVLCFSCRHAIIRESTRIRINWLASWLSTKYTNFIPFLAHFLVRRFGSTY
jgi:hypothetical protein